MYIAENTQLFADGVPNPQALNRLAPHIMMINPGLEVYLLDPDGRILSNIMGSVNARSHISIEPVRNFVEDTKSLPIQGDDPKYKDRRSVFSAYPLYEENTISGGATDANTQTGTITHTKSLLGYVYVVLASERKETLFKSVQNSYSIGELFITLLGVLALALFAGLLLFFMLTRRLRALISRVKNQQDEFSLSRSGVTDVNDGADGGDEIELLAHAHETLTEQLVQQNSKLQASDTSRRQLVASLSHDLRTPLMTLQNYLETLQVKNSTLSVSAKKEFISQANRQCSRLGYLISQLFELSKLSSPDMQLQPERFSLLELVYDCMQDFILMCNDKNLNLEVIAEDETGYEVSADIAAIQRVLENLIGNAVKYTNAKGNIFIELSRPNDHEVEVMIQNSGIVLSDEQIHTLFDIHSKYYYAREVDEDGRLKTGGLGLSIVKRIMELHGSSIHVQSDASYGVRFRFNLLASGMREARIPGKMAKSA